MAKKHCNQTIGFAERLEQLLYDKNLSKKELGELIGVERKTVYSWLWGDTMPNSLYLARICKVLKISAEYLLFGEERGQNCS